MKKLTTQEFIQKAKNIHGDKFDYGKVEYIKSREKIIIICQNHGEFLQAPNDHLKGSGCYNCAKNKKSNTEDFKNKANKVHNGIYDYTNVVYSGWNNKIDIICHTHGIFQQTPNNHLNGKGCHKCGGGKKLTKQEFIEKATKIHNDLYEYSLIDYINTEIDIKIICKKHGVFNQRPYNHLLGKGCPICKFSKGELKILNFLNKNKIKNIPQKTFEGCKFKTNLEFDFYLPEYNTCIEYDGEQHFEANKFFGLKSFELTKLRDEIKNEWCKNNNITLIRIPYFDFENVENILEDKLFSL
jgi:hypothetical protein